MKTTRELFSSLNRDTLRIVVIGSVVMVLAVVITSLISIHITQNAVLNKLKTMDMRNMARSITSSVEGTIERAVESSLMIAHDPMLIEWIQSLNQDEHAKKIVEKKLGFVVEHLGYSTSFVTSALSGEYWSYGDQGFRLLNVVSPDHPPDGWFFRTLKMGRRYSINIDYNDVLNQTFVWINVLVGEIHDPIAIAGVGLNLTDLIHSLAQEEAELGLKNELWLVDSTGTIYLSKDPDDIERSISHYFSDSVFSQIMSHDQHLQDFIITEYRDHDGIVQDLVYKNISTTQWMLVVQIARSESLGFLRALIINTVIATVIMIVVMIWMFPLITRKIANPYQRAVELNQELEQQVEERTHELNEQNVKIQDSIDYAKMVQDTILPSTTELKTVLRDSFVIYRPRDKVGGDFYWVRTFDEGTIVIVADCTGHGVPGAMMTMTAHSMLNHIVEQGGCRSPSMILQKLDQAFYEAFRKGKKKAPITNGLDAGVVMISKKNEITFSGARICLFHYDELGMHMTRGDRFTIDGENTKENREFEEHTIRNPQGVVLYMSTDGFTDQPGGTKGFAFGRKRLQMLLEDYIGRSMEEQKTKVIEAFEAYIEDESVRDDVTMLGFRVPKERK